MAGAGWSQLVQQVLDTNLEYQLWSAGDRIVVAVSGGPDSVALLRVLAEISSTHTPLQLVCAHVHHGLRATESDQEAEFVRNLAFELGVPFEMIRLDVPAYRLETGKGSQEAARELRYAFLHEVAERYGAASIAMGHHGDDQAETVMLHLLRGSGLKGLGGIKYHRLQKNVKLIRPLLRMYKTALVAICKEQHFPYVTDSSNEQRKYRRNAIRLDVLPYLGQYNPQLPQTLNRLAELVQAEDDYMEEAAQDLYVRMVHSEHGRLTLEVPSFLGLHVALQRRLIKLILNYLPSDSENVDFHKIDVIRRGILQAHPTTWSLDLGTGLTCIREYDVVAFFVKKDTHPAGYQYEIPVITGDCTLRMDEIGRTLRISVIQGHEFPSPETASPYEAWFDANYLAFPLSIRTWIPGDRMKVMGLKGSKKVKDIFIDGKIPPSRRPLVPLLCDENGNILWIPGIRRSEHAVVKEASTTVIYMSLEETT
ncbi:tRNA lysidine(34) synthetase TilS [Paenibacillus sp. JX-17]|uniref:tRNA(Ile)-lysidine synthase n=1 Tax=Paenibacillus lacisoli TaxID=3064525 RepID=A0ABT9CJ73_9BACL|nr:tRNA lysidine(34) synthetase TilS [Paenibacillus sp. JX-17]MDO7908588.1 tRNA lysidine(34) synthetase TilS [Paenibacillus sp. JX-17]